MRDVPEAWDDSADGRWETERSRFDDEVWDPPPRTCWRCEKTAVPVSGRCPYCRARLESCPEERIQLPPPKVASPVMKVLAILGGMMVLSVVYFRILFALAEGPIVAEAEWTRRELLAMFAFAAVEAVLVLGGFAWIGWLPALSRPHWSERLAAWIWALPVLAVLLGLNLGYHWLLRQYVRPVDVEQNPPLTPLFWVALCLLPALLEEVAFRHLAMNALREHMSIHGAVWTSSAMFGLAHIGNPVGMPILIVVGAGFGYMRVFSGGLLLPILMHLLHNTAVLYLGSLTNV